MKQIFLVIGGRGWYDISKKGQLMRELYAGDIIVIEPGLGHWHGATCDSSFSHIFVEIPLSTDWKASPFTEWLEKVSEQEYDHSTTSEGKGCLENTQ